MPLKRETTPLFFKSEKFKKLSSGNLGLWFRFLLVLFVASGLFFSCTPAKINVILYYPLGKKGTQLFEKIEGFKISLHGSVLKNENGEETRFTRDSENPSLPDVACDPDKKNSQIDVRVIGYKNLSNETMIAAGRQIFYHSCGKPRTVYVFVSPLDKFSTLVKYDSENQETQVSALANVRAGHRMTYLPDGRILITGGGEMTGAGKFKSITETTELFDPETGTFTSGPDMSVPRAFHTVTRIDDKIFIAGGIKLKSGTTSTFISNKTIDIFEIQEDGSLSFSKTVNMEEARAFHTATITPNASNILFFGGINWNESGVPQNNVKYEIFSPEGDKLGVTEIPEKNRRAWHTATMTIQGEIFVTGGIQLDDQKNFKTLKSILLLKFSTDDSSITIKEQGQLKVPRVGHAAIRLKTAKESHLFVSGGMIASESNMFEPTAVHNTAELFKSNGVFEKNLTMLSPRVFHTMNQLVDGRVMLVGGLMSKDKANTTSEFFRISSKDILLKTSISVQHQKNRFFHSALVLNNSSLLVLGGAIFNSKQQGEYLTLYQGELFNPALKNP